MDVNICGPLDLTFIVHPRHICQLWLQSFLGLILAAFTLVTADVYIAVQLWYMFANSLLKRFYAPAATVGALCFHFVRPDVCPVPPSVSMLAVSQQHWP